SLDEGPPKMQSYRLSLLVFAAVSAAASAQSLKPAWSRPAHQGEVRCLAYSPDGSLIATGGTDGQVRLWRSGDGTLVRSDPGHFDVVNTVAFSPDGTFLYSGSEDRLVYKTNVATGYKLYETGHGGFVKSVALRPDGQFFSAGLGYSTDEKDLFRASDGALW